MAIFFILLSLSGSIQSEGPYDLDTVLKGYRESFAWSHNVAFDFEIFERSEDTNPVRKGHFFIDHGKRMELQETLFVPQSPDISGAKIKTLFSEDLEGFFFHEILWGLDGDVVPETYKPSLDIYESGRDRFSTTMITHMPDIGSFIGYGPLFSNTPLPDLLTPKNTTLQMEEVEGIRCCVLNASIPEGDIQLWLIPDKDYVMKKCVITKEAGKHQDYRGNTYSFTNSQGASLQRRIIETTVSQHYYQDGHFLPVEMESSSVVQYKGGEDFTTETVCRITTMDLNPDFEALQAFEATFSDDSIVSFQKKDGTWLSGFSLQDGKLIAPMDEQFVDTKLQEGLAGIHTTPSENTKAPEKLSLLVNKLDPDAAAQMKKEMWLYILTAAGVIVLIGAWIAYRMVKRRRESK
ncbi:MAG: hypothetical protein GX130_05515 [Candidatus Hydrogenedens sp.]|jgi:hypothetical protein|nr:hypothetical protein [Candidatus Hydrogenedens sp.]